MHRGKVNDSAALNRENATRPDRGLCSGIQRNKNLESRTRKDPHAKENPVRMSNFVVSSRARIDVSKRRLGSHSAAVVRASKRSRCGWDTIEIVRMDVSTFVRKSVLAVSLLPAGCNHLTAGFETAYDRLCGTHGVEQRGRCERFLQEEGVWREARCCAS